jgi:hypothetical protein
MHRQKWLIVALIVTVFAGCVQKEGGPVREDTEPSPMSSPEIHGSMSATVNHEKWIAGGSPSETLDDVSAMIDPKNGEVTICGERLTHHAVESDASEEIQITLKSIEPGHYTLAPDFDHDQTAIYLKGSDSSQVYFIHEHQTGDVILTRVDTPTHRLFGTFHFECKNAKGKSVKVEDGTFDNVKCDQ